MTSPSAGRSIPESLRLNAQRTPQNVAIRELQMSGARDVTYGELWSLAGSAAAFIDDYLPHAAFVPIFMQRTALSIALAFGAMLADKRFVFLNPKLRLPQARQILEATATDTLLIDGVTLASLRPASLPPEELAGLRLALLHNGELAPMHSKIAAQIEDACAGLHVEDISARSAAAGELPAVEAGCCLFTSGSTGTPKGVLISGTDLQQRALAETAAFGLAAGDNILNLLPFSFDVGLNQLLSVLTTGATLTLSGSWLPNDLHRFIAEHRINGVSGVPTIWGDYLQAELQLGGRAGHNDLRYLTVSGGSLPHHQFLALRDAAAGVSLIKTYGQTETFRTSCLLDEHIEHKSKSVGAAFGDVSIRIVRGDMSLCDPGESGEVIHAGLGVMEGYLSGPDNNKLIDDFFTTADDAGKVVRTGDFGYLDADGFLYLQGRKDSMIKVHGNRVYPEEVTARVTALREVAEAEVVVVPPADESGDPVLTAFIVAGTEEGSDPLSLRRSLASQLPAYMVPEVRLVEEIPRTATGKPDKQQLIASLG